MMGAMTRCGLVGLLLGLAACGGRDDPSLSARYADAHAAWVAGRLDAAATAARVVEARAIERGDDRAAAAAAHLLGAIAFEAAEARARARAGAGAGAVPDAVRAREEAIALAEEAVFCFARAASRDGAGAASRNVERVLGRLASWRERREGPPRRRPRPLPPPPAPRAGGGEGGESETTATELPGAAVDALSTEAVARLAEALAAEERAKRLAREKERAAATARVERDW